MSQRKKDRAWPQSRRKHTRHAWRRRPGLPEPPVQVFVIAWRRHSCRWQAYVVWVSDGGQVIQEWVPADKLGPVLVVEHQIPGNPSYFAGF